MKKMFILIIIIITITFPLTAQKQFELDVVMYKDTFLVGETINIGLGLKNLTNATQKIIKPSTIKLKIFDSKGTELKVTPYWAADGIYALNKEEINIGEEAYEIYDLNMIYGDQFYKGIRETYFRADNYTIKITITSPNNFIEEKIIQFNVTEPSGDELILFNTFQKIVEPIYTANENKKLIYEQVKNLHATYPNSVYSPILLSNLAAWARFSYLKNNEIALEFKKEMVERYTWSCVNRSLLNEILKGKVSKQEKVGYLQNLLPKCVKSPMYKLIEQRIKDEMDK
ncbi:MAG: hypothetical protein Q8903_04130 [Bacteroidota bacterium]|nr:hypothetical protein [Bacteroidota bacterium]